MMWNSQPYMAILDALIMLMINSQGRAGSPHEQVALINFI